MLEKDFDMLGYILVQINELKSYLETCNNDKDIFLRNAILKDATLMKLLVVGEYTSKLTKEFRDKYENVEWNLIKAARNYYAHAYGMITWERVWETL